MDDPRIFPMSYWNAHEMWSRLLMRANIVEIERYKNKWTGKLAKKVKRRQKGERLLMHPHCLRKFFRSYLGDADLSEYLMGHSTVLTRAYRQKKPEDLAADYLRLMPNVTIFETTSKDIVDLNSRLAEQQGLINDMKMQILELRIEKQEKLNGKK